MDQDADEIRDAIAHTREEIADTIEALGHKADVKQRARVKTMQLKSSIGDAAANLQQRIPERVQPTAQSAITTVRAKPMPFAVGAGVLLALMTLVRRHRRHAS